VSILQFHPGRVHLQASVALVSQVADLPQPWQRSMSLPLSLWPRLRLEMVGALTPGAIAGSSRVSASFGVLTFCCVYRGGRRIEHKLNSRKKAQVAQRGKPQPKMNCHERSQRSQKLKNINSCPCALCVPLWQRFCFNCTTFRDRIAEVHVVVYYTPSESLIFTRIFYHGLPGLHGWETHQVLSVSSGSSVVQLLCLRLAALCLLRFFAAISSASRVVYAIDFSV
jgi:hypothetical protein